MRRLVSAGLEAWLYGRQDACRHGRAYRDEAMFVLGAAIYFVTTSLFVLSLLLAAARPTPKPQWLLPDEDAVGLRHCRP
jgi:hypothetical protein